MVKMRRKTRETKKTRKKTKKGLTLLWKATGTMIATVGMVLRFFHPMAKHHPIRSRFFIKRRKCSYSSRNKHNKHKWLLVLVLPVLVLVWTQTLRMRTKAAAH